jgi:DNA-binding MarR family transcriptional regulator
MKKERPSLIKYTNTLYRVTQCYIDEALKKYELSNGTYPFLMRLSNEEGISQNEISRALGVDKAMSARSINKLIELGYITKEQDEEDSRAYKLYLTDKAKVIIPDIKNVVYNWIDIITADFNENEKDEIIRLAEKAKKNAIKFKQDKL